MRARVRRPAWARPGRARSAGRPRPRRSGRARGTGPRAARSARRARRSAARESPAMSSEASAPRPTSTSTPTRRRTIFQRKCDPRTRIRTRSPASATSIRSIRTFVDCSSGSASVNERKSCRPAKRAASRRIAPTSSGSFTHQTNGLPNAVRRRAS